MTDTADPDEGRDNPPDPTDPADAASPQDVDRALREVSKTPPPPPPSIGAAHKIRIGTYIILFAAATALFYALRLDVLTFPARFAPLILRVTRGAMFVSLLLLAGSVLQALVLTRLQDDVSRYNVRRVILLAEGVVVGFVILSVIFVNWYTAAVSLGIVSAILGFALQTPLSSFIGWAYIIIKRPYGVGDRIRIGDATGDVIDVRYLDTTLWEFGGPYLSTDQPSGRLIKFPNANVLNQPVFNYSWPLFPYIWNEIRFQVAYGSDLQFVADTMQRIAEAEVGDRMEGRVETYRKLLASTAVNELEVSSRPVVTFQVSENTWVEPVLRYLVSPRRAAVVKSALTAKMLEALNAAPDKVMFPKGDSR